MNLLHPGILILQGQTVDLTAKLFLEDDGRFILGPGRIALLRAVHELGSLRQAARKYGISYRRAWARIKQAEEALGLTLLTRSTEPRCGRPMVLTAEAGHILSWFSDAQAEIARMLRQKKHRLPKAMQQARKEDTDRASSGMNL